MTVSFQVAYEGPGDGHAMDVQSLAPALLGFSDIIREANAALNGGRAAVNLRVVSDFEHKCFNINFDLIMTFYDQVKAYLKLEDVTAAPRHTSMARNTRRAYWRCRRSVHLSQSKARTTN